MSFAASVLPFANGVSHEILGTRFGAARRKRWFHPEIARPRRSIPWQPKQELLSELTEILRRRSLDPYTPLVLKPAAMVRRLLDWYSENARDLPWRRSSDPYAIWISEVMLQQTQVKTVLGYWTRWMASFPNVQTLAAASSDQVLKHWEGLGYYSRARNVHRAAQMILQEFGGRFPSNLPDLLSLPGIGRYTAGAISSIAFDLPAPILDGNVTRFLCRFHEIDEDPRKSTVQAMLWEWTGNLAHAAVHLDGSAARLNQSLMELGALVCTPRSPRCGECPVRCSCAARASGRAGEIPSIRRPPLQARHVHAFVLEHEGEFLVRRRPSKGVNPNLWEFPSIEAAHAHSPKESSALLFGTCFPEIQPFCIIKHSITRYRVTTRAFRILPGRRISRSGSWLTVPELRDLALTAAHRQMVRRLDSLEYSISGGHTASLKL